MGRFSCSEWAAHEGVYSKYRSANNYFSCRAGLSLRLLGSGHLQNKEVEMLNRARFTHLFYALLADIIVKIVIFLAAVAWASFGG